MNVGDGGGLVGEREKDREVWRVATARWRCVCAWCDDGEESGSSKRVKERERGRRVVFQQTSFPAQSRFVPPGHAGTEPITEQEPISVCTGQHLGGASSLVTRLSRLSTRGFRGCLHSRRGN